MVTVPLYPDGVMLAIVTDCPTWSPWSAEVVIVATLDAQLAVLTLLAANVAEEIVVVGVVIGPVPELLTDRLPVVVVSGPASVRPVPLWLTFRVCPATTTPAGAIVSAPSPRLSTSPVTPEVGTLTLLVPLPVAPLIDVVIVSAESVTTKLLPEIVTEMLLSTPAPAMKVNTPFDWSSVAGTSRVSRLS